MLNEKNSSPGTRSTTQLTVTQFDEHVSNPSSAQPGQAPAEQANLPQPALNQTIALQKKAPQPIPPDPGATALVETLQAALAEEGVSSRSMTISLAGLDNRSRATRQEFNELLDRLATLLSTAGVMHNIRFASPADRLASPWQLGGSVYLINTGGFDLWELYPALQRADASRPVWKSNGPIRLLRQPRREGGQIILPRE